MTARQATAASSVTIATRNPEGDARAVVTRDDGLLVVTRDAVARGRRGVPFLSPAITFELSKFALPRLEHALILRRDRGPFADSPDRKARVQESPPHVHGEQPEQWPLEDVGPTELVPAFGAASSNQNAAAQSAKPNTNVTCNFIADVPVTRGST